MRVLGFIILLVIFYKIFRKEDPVIPMIRNNLAKLNPDYYNIRISTGDKTYTSNKNSIVLCVKDPKGKYYDMNTLMYVVLHELTHMLSGEVIQDSEKHTPRFVSEFNSILDKAEKVGIFSRNKGIAKVYCGINNF